MLNFLCVSNFQMVAKIIKPGGAKPDEFETEIGQALLELELNSELKPQLRDLHITRAREVEVSNKKVCVFNLRTLFTFVRITDKVAAESLVVLCIPNCQRLQT